MANVNIKFNNKDYLLSCDDGQEENLKELASHLDSKYIGLKKNLGNIGENRLLLITAIKMVDDYFDLFKNHIIDLIRSSLYRSYSESNLQKFIERNKISFYRCSSES